MGHQAFSDSTTPEHPAPRRRTVLAAAAGVVGASLLGTAPTASAATLVSFSTLNGTPVYYGLEAPRARTWRATETFRVAAANWMATLRLWSANAGYPGITSIGTAGFYVNKAGQHGAGTAMDLSIVRWNDGRVSDMFNGHHASSSRALRRRYFAVEASLRVYFRYVLDGNYNAAHRNHFHADFGAMPYRRLLRSSRADTVFLQATCNNFIGSGLAVDGVWGPRTSSAVGTLKSRLGVSGDLQSNQGATLDLLRGIASAGFRDAGI